MFYLLFGLILFLGAHTVPIDRRLRSRLIQALGQVRYRSLFASVSAVGMGLIVWGYSRAPATTIYAPPTWASAIAITAIPLAIVLWVAAYIPCNIQRALRHPMLIGTVIWSSLHLLANGEHRALLLFSGFALWTSMALVGAWTRPRASVLTALPIYRDVTVVGTGLASAGLLAYLHGVLFNRPLSPWWAS